MKAEKNMDGKTRILTALEGGCPDKVPLYLVHDERYVIKAQKKTMREFFTCTAEEMTSMAEKGFYLHPCDGFLAEILYGFSFQDNYKLDSIDDEYHIYRNKDTGELLKIDEDGNKYLMDGQLYHEMAVSEESLITCRDDITRLVPERPPTNFDSEFGFFGVARRLSAQNPGHHFSSEITSPFVRAVWRCGGYMAGLSLLFEDPPLMTALMEAEMELELQRLPAMVEAGVKSVYLTSFFTGADTISPDTYRRMVFPLEVEMMKRIQALGLYVIYWFLGNMEPLVQDFRKMPFNVLAPEQPRKGYSISYKTLREVLGKDVCIMAHTREDDMIKNLSGSMRTYFDTQYREAGQDGAFIAGVTITPQNAHPDALDNYASIVDEYVY